MEIKTPMIVTTILLCCSVGYYSVKFIKWRELFDQIICNVIKKESIEKYLKLCMYTLKYVINVPKEIK